MSAVPSIHMQGTSAAGAWLEPLRDWPTTIIRSLQTNAAVVRIVIASVRGSSPREAGATMVVAGQRVFGTIGGGQLEWMAIATAGTLLHAADVQRFSLGPQLSQCCGGAVELWFERFTAADLACIRGEQIGVRAGANAAPALSAGCAQAPDW